jgi:hypothetical protein
MDYVPWNECLGKVGIVPGKPIRVSWAMRRGKAILDDTKV